MSSPKHRHRLLSWARDVGSWTIACSLGLLVLGASACTAQDGFGQAPELPLAADIGHSLDVTDALTEPPAPDGTLGPDTSDLGADASGEAKPTWWECRRAKADEIMNALMEGICDDLHSQAPAERIYGIRWVCLDGALNLDKWVSPRLELLNEFFEPTGISFFTSSQIQLTDGTLKDAAGDAEYSLEELAGDTAQLLEIPGASAPEALIKLQQSLFNTGVDYDQVIALKLNTVLTSKQYLGTMARARPTEIHVIVSPLLNGKTIGGLSSGPGTNPTQRRVSTLSVRSGGAVAEIVLAHEMGHYFGLTHPHTKQGEKVDVVPADFDQLLSSSPFEPDELLAGLTQHLGEDLASEMPQLYPGWNGTHEDVIEPFEHFRFGIARIWILRDRLYRIGADGPEPFADFSSFLATGAGGEDLYYKNFTWPGNGNNCRWNVDPEIFTCDIGSPPTEVLGTSALLDGTIILDEGQRIDLMSYIGKSLPKGELSQRVRFTDHAIPIIKLHANTPVRLMLRNHAL